MVETKIFAKTGIENRTDFLDAKSMAVKLTKCLEEEDVQQKIKSTHTLNADSRLIQKIFIKRVEEWGFASERKGLFKNYQIRPDYYISLGSGKGILIEVERGKTIANNMDLLDVWKCHICKEANFLFLIVPQIRHNSKGQTKIYNAVLRRLQSFFENENYINVDAVFVFGY